jgi:hypothetical protein
MKRLFAVFALCATALIAASAISSPAAADGRHDARRHAGPSSHQTSRVFTDRREHRRAFRDNRYRRHHKFRHHHKRHRHAHRYSRRFDYGYGRPRHRYGYRTGSGYALRFDGARFIFRFD